MLLKAESVFFRTRDEAAQLSNLLPSVASYFRTLLPSFDHLRLSHLRFRRPNSCFFTYFLCIPCLVLVSKKHPSRLVFYLCLHSLED